MTTKHFNQYELAKRWNISQRTLERWRWKRKGPPYLKIGGRVVYERDAIEAFYSTPLDALVIGSFLLTKQITSQGDPLLAASMAEAIV